MNQPASIDVDPAEDFVTVAASGAYVHYQDGFVSLLFFYDKTFPSHNHVDGSVNKERRKQEILHEVLISVNAAKQMIKDLDDGEKVYTALTLRGVNPITIWQNPPLKVPTELSLEDTEIPNSRNMVLSAYEAFYRKMNKEGQEKVQDLLTQFVHEKMEEIRAIAEQYPKQEEEEDQDVKKQS